MHANQSDENSVKNNFYKPGFPVEWSTILNNLPQDWVLTPVLDKKPLRPNWQTEEAIARPELINLMLQGQTLTSSKGVEWHCQWTGCGLRLGEISGGLLAIDADGEGAIALLKQLTGGELPNTVSWTSGKPGRQQLLIKIPRHHFHYYKTIKIDCGGGDFLEFRWNGCQSVLPPSRHPETGQYVWINEPKNTEIISEPQWLSDYFISIYEAQNEAPGRLEHSKYLNHNTSWSDEDWAMSYLAAISTSRAENYHSWVSVGMCLHSISDSLLEDWESWSQNSSKFKPGDCERKWRSFTKTGLGIGTLAYMAKEDGWSSPFKESKQEKNYPNNSQLKRVIASGTGDTKKSGDASKSEILSISATVTSVTGILEAGFSDFEERHELELLLNRSVLGTKAFWTLVKSVRCDLMEVAKEDLEKANQLINWDRTTLDWNKLIPLPLAMLLNHDADILNIDTVALWQYLMPAVASCLGKRIDLEARSHKVPCIVWSCLVGESGTGKTRAEKVVLAALRELQYNEKRRYDKEYEEYEQALKSKKEGDEPPQKPAPLRKWLFEVTTIQALMARLSEQGTNGSLWKRDELAGLFKSLGQFSKGDNEALECVLSLWDGSGAIVDRMNKEKDSYNVFETRLSIVGGLQPGAFRKAFKDPDDAQGLCARFLFAYPEIKKPQVVDGYCELHDTLPDLFNWMENVPMGTIQLSDGAYSRYKVIYEEILRQAERGSTPAIRNWTRKLPSQLLRVAIVLHALECYYDRTKNFWVVEVDTVNKAMQFCTYYANSFSLIQEKITDTDNVHAVLVKIWDLATTTPDGITPRDCYRNVKAIARLASRCGREVAPYTTFLFTKLVEMGRGVVEKVGRTIKFVANLNPITSQGDLDVLPNIFKAVTVVTEAQPHTQKDFDVSPNNQVSPVTDQIFPDPWAEIDTQVVLSIEVDNDPIMSQVSFTNTEEIEDTTTSDENTSKKVGEDSQPDVPVPLEYTPNTIEAIDVGSSHKVGEDSLPEENLAPSRVEIITLDDGFYLEVGDRFKLKETTGYYQLVIIENCDCFVLFDELNQKEVELTTSQIQAKFDSFVSKRNGSTEPTPIENAQEIQDLKAFFNDAIESADSTTIESLFELTQETSQGSKLFVERVWRSLTEAVKEAIKQIAPNVYFAFASV